MSKAIRLGRIAATVAVSNIPRALQFYADVLGLQPAFQNGDPVGFVILKKDDAELHLTLSPDHKGSDRNVAHLLVDDAAALYQRCMEQKVRVIRGIKDHDFGLKAFVIADPDGNRIDIGQPL
jgi:catechol 2,3-dioxygenase-like lactoylglutathione lyase family enzyme